MGWFWLWATKVAGPRKFLDTLASVYLFRSHPKALWPLGLYLLQVAQDSLPQLPSRHTLNSVTGTGHAKYERSIPACTEPNFLNKPLFWGLVTDYYRFPTRDLLARVYSSPFVFLDKRELVSGHYRQPKAQEPFSECRLIDSVCFISEQGPTVGPTEGADRVCTQ